MSYNLLDEAWIPVLYRDGRWERVGIRKALEDAGRIREVAASNPMDNVALLRFLLAVLQWCKASLSDEDRKTLQTTKGIPTHWLQGKLGTTSKPNPAFHLLGERPKGGEAVDASGEPLGVSGKWGSLHISDPWDAKRATRGAARGADST